MSTELTNEAKEAMRSYFVRLVAIPGSILSVALFAFGSAFGMFGMLLAIPLAATCKILISELLLPVFKDIADS